ncbi:25263_t:CDS:2 [Dentiscutata erythropus]|uniref:25263_t:CDS:1 n=1 Tax=Dentiscutata erythropus TaxID=1348616 RepID=A0A9N9CLC2_9GLOM|nr:25263_t:CDS:2 [Dentiscutata erythropus]
MTPMMINVEHVCTVAVNKLNNSSYTAREGGLRRFVLLHNFLRKFEWQDDDIKKDEEYWLESTLVLLKPYDEYNEYNEYNDEYNYMELLQNGMDIVTEDIMMPQDIDSHELITHFDPGADSDINMLENDYGTLHHENFHPYWKDNSIIDSFLDQSMQSISIPRIFQRYRYRWSDVPSHINASALFDLLSKDPPQPLYKRSKDDLDIGSLNYKDLDQGVLMDIISMLEYPFKNNLPSVKSNNNVTSNANMWFVENGK